MTAPPPSNPGDTQLDHAIRVMQNHPEFRHAGGIGWLQWDGTKWATGADLAVRRAVHGAALALNAVQPDRFAKSLATRAGMDDTVAIAAHLAGVGVEVRELDAWPDHINALGRTVDLRTCETWDSEADMLNTRAAAYPIDSAEPTMWLEFLHSCFPSEPEMVSYLQRLVGYAATGHTYEQIFVLMHGTGANGKSTFLETLTTVLGDYARVAPAAILMNTSARNGEAPAPQLVALRQARLVVTSETEQGGRLNESMIKQMTGQDRITARTLNKEPITFKPEFQIFMATNALPDVRGVDNGIWRRVKVIEWRESFLGREDKEIHSRLLREAPQILGWIARGAAEWYRTGLAHPPRVTLSIDQYREEQDFLQGFMPDWLEADHTSWLPRSEVLAVWDEFCTQNGVDQRDRCKSTTLYRAMAERGCEQAGRKGVRGFKVRRPR